MPTVADSKFARAIDSVVSTTLSRPSTYPSGLVRDLIDRPPRAIARRPSVTTSIPPAIFANT